MKTETKRVFVIGGGASFRDVLADPILKAKLENETVIGCNVAPKYVKCNYLVYFDADFEMKHKEMIDSVCKSGLVFAPSSAKHKGSNEFIQFVKTLLKPLNSLKMGLFFWGNTGCGALSLAISLGYKEIYLLGFDLMYSKDNKTNYHDEYKHKKNIKEPEREYEHMIYGFYVLARYLKKDLPDVTVYNCSMRSRLSRRDYPYMSIKKVLND